MLTHYTNMVHVIKITPAKHSHVGIYVDFCPENNKKFEHITMSSDEIIMIHFHYFQTFYITNWLFEANYSIMKLIAWLVFFLSKKTVINAEPKHLSIFTSRVIMALFVPQTSCIFWLSEHSVRLQLPETQLWWWTYWKTVRQHEPQ